MCFVIAVLITIAVFLITFKFYSIYFVFVDCKCKTRLDGKTVLITGGSSGIGYETAKELAIRGARVLITTTNLEVGTRIKNLLINETKNQNIEVKHLQLSTFETVRNFAEDILETEERIDILINNAGNINFGTNMSEDGVLLGLQINYFGAFLLTHLLIDLLRKSSCARIINLTSVASLFFSWQIKNIEDVAVDNPKIMTGIKIYSLSKLYMVYMTQEMSKRLKKDGITVNCVHPGFVNSPLLQKYNYWIYYIIKFFMKTSKQGAQTTVHCAVSQQVQDVTGKYFSDCKIQNVHSKIDGEFLQDFWDLSVNVVKLRNEEIKM